MKVLEEGGNAVDAAVAIAFALAVVNPSLGILGVEFMLIHLAERNETFSIDYRERAPLKSFEKMFQDDSGKVVKGLSLNSVQLQEYQAQYPACFMLLKSLER